MKKLLFYSIFLFLIGLIVSCADTPRQYYNELTEANPDRSISEPAVLFTHPTNEIGGILSYHQNNQLPEEEKDDLIRKNSLMPIDYKAGSVGNISINTTFDEALKTLHVSTQSEDGVFYKEGLVIRWRLEPPLVPQVIHITRTYQGEIDFGPWIGEENRYKQVGDSFASQFTTDKPMRSIQQDPKARHFITSLYQHLEGKENEDCLRTQRCYLTVDPTGDVIMFKLPRMLFRFGTDERRSLVLISIIQDNKPGCFAQPFDLLKMNFFCGISDGSHFTISMGENYEEVIQKSGISSELSIVHGNDLLVQETQSTVIGWKRMNFEEQAKSIPKTSHLSRVRMRVEYTTPFLIDESLIRVNITSPDTVHIELEPIGSKGTVWTIRDIQEKLMRQAVDIKTFYLSSNMPEIRGNYTLQRNLIEGLLDLLEEKYKAYYSSAGNEIKVYKKIRGQYSDKRSPIASGSLMVFPVKGKVLSFQINILEPTGYSTVGLTFMESEIIDYMIRYQKTIDLIDLRAREKVFTLSGFTLSDKIYIRNKDIGSGTAIIAYVTKDQKVLRALFNYTSLSEVPTVVYDGEISTITYHNSESIGTAGLGLLVTPTNRIARIHGHEYEEYEINSITVNEAVFFESVNNLCFIQDLNIEMGMYDREFTNKLITAVAKERDQARAERRPFECPFISPQDSLFTGLKRTYFFPIHKMILGFKNRGLFGITIQRGFFR